MLDDLTQLTGIGPARQRWLAKTFGVRTYADLAALSADEIETKLAADGKPYSRDEVERWIEEAAELAAEKEEPGIGRSVEPSVSVLANSPKEKAEPGVTVGPVAKEEQWQQIALFQVEFQKRQLEGAAEQRTLINYHETDKWHEWPHIETEKIGQWIAEQAGDNLRPPAEAEVVPEVKPEPEAAVRLSVAITEVRLYQPAGTEVRLAPGKNGRPFAGNLQAGSPFGAQVDFEIDEQAASIIAGQDIPYQAQFYAQNRSTKEKLHLGSSEPGVLFAGKTSYSAMLRGITLQPDTYRLRVVVMVELENAGLGYFELPMLRVV